MDERVIDVPAFLRAILVRGIILNVRPKRSAKAYSKIWWKEGSLRSLSSQNAFSTRFNSTATSPFHWACVTAA